MKTLASIRIQICTQKQTSFGSHRRLGHKSGLRSQPCAITRILAAYPIWRWHVGRSLLAFRTPVRRKGHERVSPPSPQCDRPLSSCARGAREVLDALLAWTNGGKCPNIVTSTQLGPSLSSSGSGRGEMPVQQRIGVEPSRRENPRSCLPSLKAWCDVCAAPEPAPDHTILLSHAARLDDDG